MSVTLKLDHPHFPDSMEFGIYGLGRVKNHGTLEVDDDKVKLFETTRGMTIADVFIGNGLITVTGSTLTASVQDVFKQEVPVTPPVQELSQQVAKPEVGD